VVSGGAVVPAELEWETPALVSSPTDCARSGETAPESLFE
jgi:hypothetical protein